MSLKQEIREHADFKKFRKIVQGVEARLHIEKDQEEAQSLFSGRTTRKLYGDKRYSPKSLIDASMNDAAARSRLVEIRVRCSNQVDILHDACKAMKASMFTNFGPEIKKYHSTVQDRQAFAETVMARALQIENDGQALINLLDKLIDDIDKSSFHLRNVVEALKLLSGSKGGTVV